MTIVACCQFAPVLGAVADNVRTGVELIADAARSGAEVVVLPELASSGYAFADIAEARAAAVKVDGAALAPWRRAADECGIVIVAGFCEANPHGRPYNSAALFLPHREGIVYRKAHLWDRERLIFAPGNDQPPVVDTPAGRLSMVICYDLEFPEWVRIPVLAGAELICAPVNWPDAGRPEGERPAEVIRVQADASMNRVAIAACDRTGTERGIEWTSASVIVDADGWPRARADGGTDTVTLFAEVDLAASRDKRLSEYSDILRDRRTDLYPAPSAP